MTSRIRLTFPVGAALAIGAIALIQLGPTLRHGQLSGQRSVQAQGKYNSEEIESYARTVVEIEANRIQAYETASDILTSADSELSILDIPLQCRSTRLSDMPDISRPDRVELRTVLVNFCNAASEIAESNDLTPQTFNAMTAAHQKDEELAGQIQSAISEL